MAVSKTLFKHQQSANTSVAILESMNRFEANMEIKDVLKSMALT